MDKGETYSLIIRYLVLIVLAFGNLWLLNELLKPLTAYGSYLVLSLFSNAYLNGNIIMFNGLAVELVPACIAASAYFLLLVINLTTPMKGKTRAKSIIFSLTAFLIINIIRIVVFAVLFYWEFSYFDVLHRATWYFLSTLMLVAVWFGTVKIFKIKEIPVYSDVRRILKDLKGKNKR